MFYIVCTIIRTVGILLFLAGAVAAALGCAYGLLAVVIGLAMVEAVNRDSCCSPEDRYPYKRPMQ